MCFFLCVKEKKGWERKKGKKGREVKGQYRKKVVVKKKYNHDNN